MRRIYPVLLAGLLALPSPGAGQRASSGAGRPAFPGASPPASPAKSPEAARWPRFSSGLSGNGTSSAGVLQGSQEAVPLPVLDYAGNAISPMEIRAHMDRGVSGAIVGGLLGAVLGPVALYILFSSTVDCGSDLSYYCSPQEEAMGNAVGLGGLILGVTLGADLGWRIDRATFEQALDEIRAGRGRPGTPPGDGR